MASRRSSDLTDHDAGAAIGGAGHVRGKRERREAPSIYTAQAVADFCEVDLKTVHNWVERGKVAHHRTEGRHLRFRRNDVVRFLRAHGYPLPTALTRARPLVALAISPFPEPASLSPEELVKRLGSRFAVRRHASAVGAVARLLADAPDVIALATGDRSLTVPEVIRDLKADPETAWVVVATLGGDEADLALAREAGAEVAVSAADATRFAPELARVLAVA